MISDNSRQSSGLGRQLFDVIHPTTVRRRASLRDILRGYKFPRPKLADRDVVRNRLDDVPLGYLNIPNAMPILTFGAA